MHPLALFTVKNISEKHAALQVDINENVRKPSEWVRWAEDDHTGDDYIVIRVKNKVKQMNFTPCPHLFIYKM